MPRKPREKSSTGIYHVMLRGIKGQVEFKEEQVALTSEEFAILSRLWEEDGGVQ